MQTMLVGLDGSAFSDRATDLAIRWAKQSAAMVVGIGIIDEPEIRRPEAVPLGGGAAKVEADEQVLERERRRVERLLETFEQKCLAGGVSCKPLQETGIPSNIIVRHAQRYDLIMLGRQTHLRYSPAGRACDTLERVLRDSPRPVVAVPDRLPGGNQTLIAYDGSVQAARALAAFVASGLAGVQPVHILAIDRDKLEAARRADMAVEFLGFHEISATVERVGSNDSPTETILAVASAKQASLLVAGAYGRSSIVEFFLGSVTRTLLARSGIPMFLYH